ncbi:MAG TPA: rhodanese-like domain-containing protein [Chryseolinea sp.]|nr:rhodanese-like domain-containing protein [Chryseolinea sp.]
MTRFILCFIILIIGCTNSEKKVGTITSSKQIKVLPPAEFKTQFSVRSNAVLIDVRRPAEFADGIISGASNIDFTASTFVEKISSLDKNKPYFVYCQSGKRSADAVAQMKEIGFKNLYTLDGGLNNWKAHGLEIVKP